MLKGIEVFTNKRNLSNIISLPNKAKICSTGETIIPIKQFNINKQLIKYYWIIKDSNNILHNPDGIACVDWYVNNNKIQISEIKYYVNNMLHRVDGPACITKYGKREWFFMGNRHRFDGPATEYSTLGYPYQMNSWIVNNIVHRVQGPAMVGAITKKNNKLKYKQIWFFMGKRIPHNIIKLNEAGKSCNMPISRQAILDAMIFDRKYGKIINYIYSNKNKKFTEKELYNIIIN